MKRVLFLFLFSSFLASGQDNPDAKRDYVWVFGSNSYIPFNVEYTIDFNSGSFETQPFQHNILLWLNNSSISDTSGQLLFFTNGEQIVDRFGNLMENGDSLSSSDYYNWLHQYNLGPNGPQSAIILPHPHDTGIYLVFHQKIEWKGGVVGEGPITTALLMSTVDMNENNGLGKVVIKNQTVIHDTLGLAGLTAVRHGNGRDWWIIVPGYSKFQFHRILLNPEGVTVLEKQVLGSLACNNFNRTCFSPDGSLFAQYYICTEEIIDVNLFTFDRCKSTFNLKASVEIPSTSWPLGISFSPNSRFLYVSDELFCYQFDAQSADIPGSKLIVAEYDSFDIHGNPTVFGLHKLAPDDKIYVGAGHSKFLHMIENPDEMGNSCHFIQRAYVLPGNIMFGALPNIPNFRLGRWVGSECDPLGIEQDEHSHPVTVPVKAFPNPAGGILRFELDVFNNREPMQFVLYDGLGREMDKLYVAPFQGVISYDVSRMADGLYFGLLEKDHEILGKVKFMVKK